MLQHHAVECRYADHGPGPEPLDGIEGCIQVDPRLEDQGAAHQECRQAAGLPQHVEERGVAHDHVLLRGEERRADADLFVRGHQEKRVRDGHPFGKLGRSASVKNLGRVAAAAHAGFRKRFAGRGRDQFMEGVRVCAAFRPAPRHHIEEIAERPLPGGQQVGHVGEDDPLQPRPGQCAAHVPEVGVGANDGVGAAVVGDIDDVVRRVDRGDRHGHCTEALEPKPRHHPLDAVGNVEHHFLAGVHPEVCYGNGKGLGQLLDAPIGKTAAQINYRRVVPAPFGGFGKHRKNRLCARVRHVTLRSQNKQT